MVVVFGRAHRATATRSKFKQNKYEMEQKKDLSTIEKVIAIAAFVSADAMGFVAVIINEDNNILSGQLWFIAQMLLLCATLLGIDYKLKTWKK